MQDDNPRQQELYERVREGVESARTVVVEIDANLLDCAKKLRIDPSDETFTALSAGLTNLGDLVELVKEIRNGAGYLVSRPLPSDAFPSLEESLSLFRGMEEAMTGRDWIALADLIQYELSPMLEQGGKDMEAALQQMGRQ